ncbi:MAG: phage head closure protein [Burkholderiaceae bacterium]|nr:phage head closure protein [Burkholderiaceae bacterium]
MRAGTLRHRVTVRAPATGQDAYGEPLAGWTDFAVNVPASITDLSGREFMAAAATQNAVQSKIGIRALAGITAAMRVVHGADVYNIESVLRQRDGSLLLMCSKGVING